MTGRKAFFPSMLLVATMLPGILAAGSADEIFRSTGPGVVQIRVMDENTDSRSGAGSGFVIDDAGTVVSNYHVVSRLVTHPDDYRAEFRLEDGTEGEMKLVAIDAINDLALLAADFGEAEPRPLEIAVIALEKGQRLYSMGNPFDIGLTIVEGIFNGFFENTYQERMHFTGAMNPGMSGGPVVDSTGRVVGVNVATGGNHVGFLVPAARVRDLVDQDRQPDDPWSERISEQLVAHQDRYMGQLLADALPTLQIGDFSVPGELASWISCAGDSDHDEQNRGVTIITRSCSGSHNLFLDRRQTTGSVNIQHQIYQTDSLGAERFYRFLERRFTRPGHIRFGTSSTWLTGYECNSRRIRQDGNDFKVALCLRAYRPIEGLYDLYLSVASLNSNTTALRSNATFTGISLENARAFSQAYLEAIAWNP